MIARNWSKRIFSPCLIAVVAVSLCNPVLGAPVKEDPNRFLTDTEIDQIAKYMLEQGYTLVDLPSMDILVSQEQVPVPPAFNVSLIPGKPTTANTTTLTITDISEVHRIVNSIPSIGESLTDANKVIWNSVDSSLELLPANTTFMTIDVTELSGVSVSTIQSINEDSKPFSYNIFDIPTQDGESKTFLVVDDIASLPSSVVTSLSENMVIVQLNQLHQSKLLSYIPISKLTALLEQKYRFEFDVMDALATLDTAEEMIDKISSLAISSSISPVQLVKVDIVVSALKHANATGEKLSLDAIKEIASHTTLDGFAVYIAAIYPSLKQDVYTMEDIVRIRNKIAMLESRANKSLTGYKRVPSPIRTRSVLQLMEGVSDGVPDNIGVSAPEISDGIKEIDAASF